VFCRTDAGESELGGPKGGLEKMARSVLEIVDGFSTVGELTTRIGRNRAVIQALGDLERSGMIETLDARMTRVAELETRRLQGNAPAPRQEPMERTRPLAEPAAPRPTPRAEPVPEPEPEAAGAYDPRVQRALASGSRATIGDRLNAFVGNMGHRAMTGGGARGHKLRRVAIWAVGLVVLAGVGFVVAMLGYQASNIRVQVEREAATWLGEPVKIESVGVGFNPWPGFRLDNIQIGEGGTSHIDTAWGHPDWLRWMTGQTQHLHVGIGGAQIQPTLVARVATLPVPTGLWRLTSISVRDLTLPLGSLQLGGLSGEFTFSNDSRWISARLRPAEGDLTLEAENHDGSVFASVHTPEFKIGQTKLENVLLTGTLAPTGLPDAQFGANWLSGALKGRMKLDFTSGALVDAQFDSTGIAMDKLSGLAGVAGAIEGRLSGPMKAQAKAASVGELGPVLTLSGNYTIDDGSIRHLDLIEAMRRNGTAPIAGGTTRFSRMEGAFSYAPNDGLKVEMRRLVAGALTASGRWTIANDGVLRGALRSNVRTPVENVARMFAIEGNLQTPQIRPQGE
jgi:hypothetical protein